MANKLLQATADYANPYDWLYDSVEFTDYFNKNTFDYAVSKGMGNEYLEALSMQDKLGSKDDFVEKHRIDLGDADYELGVIFHELFDDKTNSDKVHVRKIYDPYTNEEIEKTYTMSDYDYNEMLYNEIRDYNIEQENLKIAQKIKDERPWISKAFNDVLVAPVTQFTKGVLWSVDGLIDTVESIFSGNDENFRNTYKNDDWLDELYNGITEYEKNNVSYVDLETGELVGIGKYYAGIFNSFGMFAPSMALSLIPGAGTATAMGSFTVSMYGNNMSDALNTPGVMSADTWQIVTNSAFKSAAETAITWAMGKLFGPTTLDKMVWGQASKTASKAISTTSALKTIGLDAFKEGAEEVLQEFSNYFVDNSFALMNENFAENKNLTFQSLFDAFVIGALASVAGSTFNVVTTNNSEKIEIYTGKKLSKLERWQYNGELSSMVRSYENAINGKSDSVKNEALAQLYINFKNIASVYKELGEQRVNAANDFLHSLSTFANSKLLNSEQIFVDSKNVKRLAASVVRELNTLYKDNAQKFMDAKMTSVEKVFEKEDSSDIDKLLNEVGNNKKLAENIKDIFVKNKNVSKIVITKDGVTTVSLKDTLFVPYNFVKNSNGNVIIKSIAEQNFVNEIISDKNLKPVVDFVYETFKKLNGEKSTIQEAILSLVYNNSFYKILLNVSNKQCLLFLDSVVKLYERAGAQTEKDAIYKKTLSDIKNNLSKELMLYLVNQQEESGYWEYKSLTDKQKQWIQNNRFSKNLYNKIVNQKLYNTLSQSERKVIDTKINNLPISKQEKSELLNGYLDKNQSVRISTMSKIDKHYKNIFIAPYDNVTYLSGNSLPISTFNEFLKANNLTLQTLLLPVTSTEVIQKIQKMFGEFTATTTLKYYQKMFSNFSNKNYSFSIENGFPIIYEDKPITTNGYINYYTNRDSVILGNNIENRSFTNIVSKRPSVFTNILSKDLGFAFKQSVTLAEVIKNPNYLSNSTQNNIKSRFGNTSPMSTFLYLRDYLLEKTGTTSIVTTPNGDFIFVNITPMLDVLSNKSVTFEDVKDNDNISKYVKQEFLNGDLKNVKIKISNNGNTYYNPSTNSIYIDRSTFEKKGSYFRFALLHEFQHAVQYINKLNLGINERWLINSSMNKTKKQELIKDVRTHVPKLFNDVRAGSDKEFDLVQQFVYDTSGESQANGMDYVSGVIDFYPTIIDSNKGKTTITLPWGTKYELGGTNFVSLNTNNVLFKDMVDIQNAFKKAYNIVKEENYSSAGKSIILPDGTLINNLFTHADATHFVYNAVHNKVAAVAYINDIIEITTDIKVGQSKYDFVHIKPSDIRSYTIRMKNHKNYEQFNTIKSFIRQCLLNGISVNLHDVFSNSETTFSIDYNLIKSYEKFADGNEKTFFKMLTEEVDDIVKNGIKDYTLKYSNRVQYDNRDERVSDYTSFNHFKGDNYYKAKEEVKKKYSDKLSKNTKSALIDPSGEIFYSNNPVSMSESELMDGGFTQYYLQCCNEIYLEDNVYNVDVCPSINGLQLNSLSSMLNDMLDIGNPISVNIPIVEYGKISNFITLDSENYTTKQDFIIPVEIEILNMQNSIGESKYARLDDMYDDDMSFAKQPGSKYVNKKDAENTNLKYAKKKYNYKNKDARLQSLYKESTGNEALMNKDIVKKIRKDTLTLNDVYSYFNSNELTEFDFDLINRTVFKNDLITSISQLDDFVKLQSDFYAITKVMRTLGMEQLINDTGVTLDIINSIRDVISKDEKSFELYKKYLDLYDTFGGKIIDIDYSNARTSIMTLYNGSIKSLYTIANKIRNYSAFKSKQNVSINADIEGKKGDDSSFTLEERLEDKKIIVDEINTNLTDEQKVQWLAKYYTEERKAYLTPKYEKTLETNVKKVYDSAKEYEDRTGKKLSEEAIQNKINSVNEKSKLAFEKSLKQFEEDQLKFWSEKAKYSDDVMEENSFDALYYNAVDEANSSLVAELAEKEELEYENYSYANSRPKSAIVNNIKNSILPEIRRQINSMSRTTKKKALQDISENYSDLLTENIKLKSDVTKRTFDELLDVENKLSSLRTKAKMDAWKNKSNRRAYYNFEKYKKQVELLKKENSQFKISSDLNKNVKKSLQKEVNRTTEYIFNDAKISVISSYKMPDSLRKIVNKSFTGFLSKTRVQEVSEEDSRHYRMNMKNFFQDNAQLLSTLLPAQVEEIANYFMSSEALISNVSEMSETDVRKYNALRNYVLAYFMYNYKNGNSLQISNDLYKQISKFYELRISTSAADLQMHQDVIKLLKPQELMIASLAKASGIDLEGYEAELNQLTAAIKKGDPELLKKAMEPIKDIAFKQNRDKLSKKTIWDQLWRFQRIAMLSSPGTWVRNITSNITVKLGNEAGEKIGQSVYNIIEKFLPKKAKISISEDTKQYKLIGTKVNEETANFVKTQVIDNGLLELINDGLDKYNVNRRTSNSSQDTLTDIIATAIINRVVSSNQFKLEGLNKFATFIFKMISDDKYIHKNVIKYLGKILVENKVDLSKGISNDVVQSIADAYGLAAYDYMHRYNAFNKLESVIRERCGDAAFYAYKQILPFAAASWNWFVEGLQYTPIGIANGIIKLAKFENTVANMQKVYESGESNVNSRFAKYLAIRNIGKGVIGSITLGIGLLLGGLGLVGIDDDDNSVKIKIGDISIDISNLFGTQGIFLGIALTNPRQGNWQDIMYDVLDNMFLDSTFNDLFNSFRYSDTLGEYMVSELGNSLSSFMPNMIKLVSQTINNSKVKYSSGIMGSFERFFNTLPFADRLLPTYKDPYTGETQSKYNIPWIWYIANKLSPVKIEKYNVSDIEKEAVSVGVTKGSLTGRYEDIGNLNNEQLEILNTKYGQLNNSSLTELQKNRKKYSVQGDDGKYYDLYYFQMTDKQKKSVTERIMSHNATIAKIYYYTSTGGKYYANDSMYNELKSLGIIKNVFKEQGNLKGFS